MEADDLPADRIRMHGRVSAVYQRKNRRALVPVLRVPGGGDRGAADAGRGRDDAVYRAGTAAADEPPGHFYRAQLYAGGVLSAYYLRNADVRLVAVLRERFLPDRAVPAGGFVRPAAAGLPAEEVLLLILFSIASSPAPLLRAIP